MIGASTVASRRLVRADTGGRCLFEARDTAVLFIANSLLISSKNTRPQRTQIQCCVVPSINRFILDARDKYWSKYWVVFNDRSSNELKCF